MANWAFSDGTTLQSGGIVEGSSDLAEMLREAIGHTKAGRIRTVVVAPLPDGYWPLDLQSDFTLNALASEIAYSHRLVFTTEYVEGDDVPEEVRELRELESTPGEVN